MNLIFADGIFSCILFCEQATRQGLLVEPISTMYYDTKWRLNDKMSLYSFLNIVVENKFQLFVF